MSYLQVTINHSKQVWTEALEFQQFSPLIKMLTGNAFICVYSNGKVQVTTTNLNFGSNKAETKLEGKVGRVTQAKSFVTPSKQQENVLPICNGNTFEVA